MTLHEIEQDIIAQMKTAQMTMTFRAGDTLRVHVEVVEGDRKRIQIFEGVCIAYRRRGLHSSFTVRKISYGEGVERVFPLYAPCIAQIEVARRGSVRRAKLYYLRGLTGRKARIAERLVTRSDQKDANKADEPEPQAETQAKEREDTVSDTK